MGWIHDDEDDPDGFYGWGGSTGRAPTAEEAALQKWAAQARQDEAAWLDAVSSGIGTVCALSAVEAAFSAWAAALPIIRCRFVCWEDRSGWASPPEFALAALDPETGGVLVIEVRVRGDLCISHMNTWGDWLHGGFVSTGVIPGGAYKLACRPHVSPIQ